MVSFVIDNFKSSCLVVFFNTSLLLICLHMMMIMTAD